MIPGGSDPEGSVIGEHVEPEAVGFDVIEEVRVERMPPDRGGVAEDDEEPARAGEGDVHAADVREEADIRVIVGAHEIDDDRFLLAALEAIDGAHLEAEGDRVGEELAEVRGLGVVGRDDADAIGGEPADGQEAVDFARGARRELGVVRGAVGLAAGVEPPGTGAVDEDERCLAEGVGAEVGEHVEGVAGDVGVGDEATAVEGIGWEGHDGRVHPVLGGEHSEDGVAMAGVEPFEEGGAEGGAGDVGVDEGWRELVGIAGEDGAGGAREGDPGEGVDGLGGLVQDDEVEGLARERGVGGEREGRADDAGGGHDGVLCAAEVGPGVGLEAAALAEGVAAGVAVAGAAGGLALGTRAELVRLLEPARGEACGVGGVEAGVEGEVGDGGVDAGGVAEAQRVEGGGVEALGEVVDGGVRGGGDEDAEAGGEGLADDLDEAAGLAGAGGAVDEADGPGGEGGGDGGLLRGVEGRVEEDRWRAGDGLGRGAAGGEGDEAGEVAARGAEGLKGGEAAGEGGGGGLALEAEGGGLEVGAGGGVDEEPEEVAVPAADDGRDGVGGVGGGAEEDDRVAGAEADVLPGERVVGAGRGDAEGDAAARGGADLVDDEPCEGEAAGEAEGGREGVTFGAEAGELGVALASPEGDEGVDVEVGGEGGGGHGGGGDFQCGKGMTSAGVRDRGAPSSGSHEEKPMPYQTSDIKKGLKFKMDNAPWNVVEFMFVKPGKGTAFTRTRLKNLITGQVVERNFRTGETLEEVDVQTRSASYSYKDGDQYIFMDTETYDQFPIQAVQLGDQEKWLMEGMVCDILFYEGRAITVELPNFIEVVITYSEPAVKGDTANNVTKNAEVSTGASILVPLFIEEGNIVRIDTRTGEYVGRVATK